MLVLVCLTVQMSENFQNAQTHWGGSGVGEAGDVKQITQRDGGEALRAVTVTELESVAFLNRRVFGGEKWRFQTNARERDGIFQGGGGSKMHYGVRRVERVQRF